MANGRETVSTEVVTQQAPPPQAESDQQVPQQASSDAEVVDLWLHHKALATQRAYLTYAASFADFCGVGLRAVTLKHLQKFADSLADPDRGLAQSSQNVQLASVKSLLSFAHRIGYTRWNVGAVLRLEPVRDTRNERIVDKETMWRLIEREPSARNKLIIRLFYMTGARVSEVAGLKWKDLQAREHGAQVTVWGKGGKGRACLIPANLAADLEAMRGEPDAPLFPGRNGGLTTSALWRLFKLAGARAGVPAFSCHWARHAAASHALDAGAPLSTVRDGLGHSSISTTSAYIHARPGDGLCLYLQTA
jgi:integrase/recombinase XerD